MKRDDVIRMAQECNLIGMRPYLDGIYQESIERFAALVAAAEREACAQMCERMAKRTQDIRSAALEMAAENIRARGQE